MATGFSAVKSGIVKFVIPFIFALYPELLLIEAAIIDPHSATGGEIAYLPGYDGTVSLMALTLLLARIMFALYLLARALAVFDKARLFRVEVGIRILLSVLIVIKLPIIYLPAIACAIALIFWHQRVNVQTHSNHAM